MWLYLIYFRLPTISLYVNHALHGPATINNTLNDGVFLIFISTITQVIACQNSWELVLSVPCSKLVKKLGWWGMGIRGTIPLFFFQLGSDIQGCIRRSATRNSFDKTVYPCFWKMKCRKLPTPFSWDCDLDQGSSTQSPHKKHARISKKNSQQGEIGWNGIKPSWDSDFLCIFNWKKEPFVELSQRF